MSTPKSVLAIAAHPDDIEFVMTGTLLRLIENGWEAHYFNVANGCCGSTQVGREECAAIRLKEAQSAADKIPAKFYSPICDDMEIFYTTENLAKVSAVVREAKPSIVLTHAPVDYMEDHQNTSRLAVSAAFVRGMPNVRVEPASPPFEHPIAVYHAQPHGNCDPLGVPVIPTHCVDVESLLERKKELLACHESQDQWLDETQAISSYLDTMVGLNRQVAELTGQFAAAEGWRRHAYMGFSPPGFDPLRDALGSQIAVKDQGSVA